MTGTGLRFAVINVNEQRMVKPGKTIYCKGVARDIAGHAAVVTGYSAVYYIEGMESWAPDWLEKQIRVIGDLQKAGNNQIAFIKDAVVQLLQPEIKMTM